MFGRVRHDFGRPRPRLGRRQPNLAERGQVCPKPGQIWSTSTRFGPKSANSGGVRSELGQVRPILVEVSRLFTEIGQVWSKSLRIWPTRNLSEFCGTTHPAPKKPFPRCGPPPGRESSGTSLRSVNQRLGCGPSAESKLPRRAQGWPSSMYFPTCLKAGCLVILYDAGGHSRSILSLASFQNSESDSSGAGATCARTRTLRPHRHGACLSSPTRADQSWQRGHTEYRMQNNRTHRSTMPARASGRPVRNEGRSEFRFEIGDRGPELGGSWCHLGRCLRRCRL